MEEEEGKRREEGLYTPITLEYTCTAMLKAELGVVYHRHRHHGMVGKQDYRDGTFLSMGTKEKGKNTGSQALRELGFT
jgi:hypothetical protein